MLEKWKGAVDDKKVFGALLTDLFKVFDVIAHELIIAKLNANGSSLPALKLIHLTSNKELRLIMISVHGKRFYLEYLKVLCLSLHYSISF